MDREGTDVMELQRQLEPYAREGTPAQRRLARFLLENIPSLPFETASSIADKVGVSQMTVGRFLRKLGFRGLDGLKGSLRPSAVSSAWHVVGPPDVLRRDLADGRLLAELMAEQIATLHHLYEMSNGETWAKAVQAIVSAGDVFVASFQNIGGIARYFAEQLTYARDRVRYMDGLNGTYVELLSHPARGPDGPTLLILVDCRRFASKSRLLAREAAAAGHAVLVVTDGHCDWLEPATQIALVLPKVRTRAWDSFMSLAALLDFLVTSVVIAGGERVRERTDRIARLQDVFGDFDRR